MCARLPACQCCHPSLHRSRSTAVRSRLPIACHSCRLYAGSQPASQVGKGGGSVVLFSGFVCPPHPFMKIVIGKRCTGELWPTAPRDPTDETSDGRESVLPVRYPSHVAAWMATGLCFLHGHFVVQGVAPTLAAVRKPRSAWPVLTYCSPRI